MTAALAVGVSEQAPGRAGTPEVWLPRPMRYPRVTIGVALAMVVVGLGGLALNMAAPANFDSRPGEFLLLLGVPIDAAVGAYLVWRRPANPLGHLLVLIALGLGLDSPAKAILNLRVGGSHGAAMSWSVLVDNTTWTLTYLGIALLVLHYPNGALPGRRWVWLRRLALADWAVLAGVCLLAPMSADKTYPGVRSPVHAGVPIAVAQRLAAALLAVIVAVLVAGIVGLFVRGRRARRTGDAITRAQVRWLAWSGVVAIVMVSSQGWIDPLVGRVIPWLGNVVSELGPYALVVALVVSVTRHGLFEIDRVVSRTVAYALITAILVAGYIGTIAGLSALLPPSVNSLVVAAATLLVVALFVPLRRSVQRRIDRRFNRERHDHAVLVDRFADQVRHADEVTPDAQLLDVVYRAFEPAHAGLWTASR